MEHIVTFVVIILLLVAAISVGSWIRSDQLADDFRGTPLRAHYRQRASSAATLAVMAVVGAATLSAAYFLAPQFATLVTG